MELGLHFSGVSDHKKFLGSGKKSDLLAPEVPYVIRRMYKKDQSSIGASLNGFKQIFRFEIDFISL
jgi:hypothetical protein